MKYRDDLMNVSEHSIKGQKQLEKRASADYKPMYQRFVNEDVSFAKQAWFEEVSHGIV